MPTEEFGEDIVPPPGSIVIWPNPLSQIPPGWALCDGNNGTPNMMNRYMRSVGGGDDPGSTGGQHSITISESQLPDHGHSSSINNTGGHRHSITYSDTAYDLECCTDEEGGDNGIKMSSNGSHSHSASVNDAGGGSFIDNHPPYYEVAPIMKL